MLDLKAYALSSHQGPYLEINEDACDFDLENGLFLLLDGFGGAGIGDQLVGQLKEYIKTFYVKIAADIDATMPFFYSSRYLLEANALINAMMYAHKLVLKDNSAKKMSERAGASGIFAALSENLVTVISVGNTAGYIMRNGFLERLFIPDNYKFLGSDDHDLHLRTMPLSAFGLFDQLNYTVKEVKPTKDDMIVLISDGVYSRLKENEMGHILREPGFDLSQKIERLFEKANERGNFDNQSALILQF